MAIEKVSYHYTVMSLLRKCRYYNVAETGFYYLQSRYYDPAIGRFINADSYSDTDRGFLGYNMFAYCGNNPIVNVDPNGDSWWGWLAAAVVVTTLVVASVVTCGGAAVAAGTACAIMTGSCTAVGTTATVLTGAAVGASTAFAATAITAASESHSMEEFADYGTTALVNTTIGAGIGTLQGLDNANNCCFIAGTLVYTENGEKPIEVILPGELVWAWCEETGDVSLKPVVETYINDTYELTHVFVAGEEIICTPGHKFYAPQKGWTEACRLRAGDILVLLNGEFVVVEKIQHELLESPIHIYNLQVSDYHTYYVSDIGILVHNRNCQNEAQRARDRRNYWKENQNTPSDLYELSDSNINRMSQGKAPIGYNGSSIQLHHIDGVGNSSNVIPMTRESHIILHKFIGFKNFVTYSISQ